MAAATLAALAGAPAAAGTISEQFARVSSSVVVVKTVEKELVPRGGGRLASIGGLGSGVLISDDGKVLTAAHVVQTAEQVLVEFADGSALTAAVVASEPAADVALLQLAGPPPAGAHRAVLGDSDDLAVGDEVFVVGAPLGISHTLTAGHVSARREPSRTLGEFQLAEFIQTDAAINQGNSGGPLFSLKGEVVGIVSHIISSTGGSDGLGFAVSSRTARQLLLEQRGVWTGMQGLVLAGERAALFNLPQPAGVLVQRVAAGSLSERLGLRGGTVEAVIEDEPMILGGDVILEVLGVRIAGADSYAEIRRRMAALKEGDTLRVKVLRAGRTVDLSAAWR
jgi:S1-C subfamily serine protease